MIKSNNLKNAAIFFTFILVAGLIFNKIVAEEYKVTPGKATEIATNEKDENGLPLQKLYVILTSEQNQNYRFIDLRDENHYELSHIDGAINIPFKNLLCKENTSFFKKEGKTTVFYAENEEKASDAFFLLKQLGYDNIKFLHGGFAYAKQYIMRTYQPSYGHFHSEKPKYNFSKYFNQKEKPKPKSETIDADVIEVSGGC